MSGRLQNQDFKSEAELIAAGATASSLLNDSKIYVTANALNKTLDDAIVDGDIGGGGTGKNYIENPSFKTGTTAGWSLFNTTLTSKIPTGSITAGAASITTFAADNTAGTILEGTYSLKVASTGAVTAGHGFISDAFTIDREDYAKVLGFSFSYEKNSGTMDFSGTSSNTWAVYIYDVDGAAWIQPAGVYNLVQGSGVGIASGTFQTTAAGTQYRIAVICVTATSGAVEMRFDDFILGPQITVQGAPVSDWASFTPTVTGISAIATGKWRRDGDSAEFEIALSTSGAASGDIKVSVTSLFAFDYTKLASSSFANIGTASANDGSGLHLGACFTDNTSTNTFFISGDDGQNIWNATVPFTWAGTRTVSFRIKVPIQGWSSNTVMSQDTDTRVVAARMTRQAVQNVPSATDTFVQFDTIAVDTHGTATTGVGSKYTIPVSGIYEISCGAQFSANSANLRITTIRINGTEVRRQVLGNPISTQATLGQISGLVTYLTAGAYIEVLLYQDSGSTLTVSTANTFLSVNRLSGPATIAASETVAASYGTTAGTTLTNGAATPIPFAIKVFDTHNSFSGSTYTVPVSGKYRYTLSAYTAGTANTTADFQLNLYKNGSVYKGGNFPKSGTAGAPLAGVMSVTVQCNAGDTLQAYIFNGTAASVNLLATDTYNWFCVERIGN